MLTMAILLVLALAIVNYTVAFAYEDTWRSATERTYYQALALFVFSELIR